MDAVEYTVTLPTDLDETWGLVSQPDELGAWLGAEVTIEDPEPAAGTRGAVVEDDGTRRALVLDNIDAGRSISWYWWTDGCPRSDGGRGPSRDNGEPWLSHVEIALLPVDGGTRVAVTERVVAQPILARARVGAQAMTPSAWNHRLLHLELRALLARCGSLVV